MADFDTRRLSEWESSELSELELIVPSPMTGPFGKRKSDGELSKHTLDNTGPRRFLVIEFDQGSLDEQAGLIWELGTRAPLIMVVFSGSKSLHAWFSCADVPETELRKFMNYAVTLGADKATWTRSQFVRMPNARRSNGNPQDALFFNPNLIKTCTQS
ncbi:MAG: hypothetical protein ACI8UO_005394 [Verrucomicrobiales bacterium]|jgi:hypothetical protein